MSLARKAVAGAIWNVGSNLGARLVGLVGTLVITRFLAPDVMGEVAAAAILISTAALITNLGIGHYYIVKGDEDDVAFHMTAITVITTVLSLVGVFLLADWLAAVFNLPTMSQYIPGMLVFGGLQRLGAVPQKVLVKNLQFRRIGAAAAIGEFLYVIVSVSLAMNGWGGHAMVIGNIVQAGVTTLIFATGVSWRTWLLPCKLRWDRFIDMMRFGVPIGTSATVAYISTHWDNLIFSRYFGPTQMGLYNLAYRLTQIPGEQIGEHAGAVILPSLAKIPDPERRKDALVRAVAITTLLVTPLAIGMASVADSLVDALLNETWQGIAPLIVILSVISIFQPLIWTLNSYWTAESRTSLLMVVQLFTIALLTVSIVIFAPYGPLPVCFAVGGSFAISALFSIGSVVYGDKIPWRRFLVPLIQPSIACVPMVAAVLGVRHGLLLVGVENSLLSLILEIVFGAAAFIPAAFVFVPRTSRDFVRLVKNALTRRSRSSDDE